MKQAILQALRDRLREIASEANFDYSDVEVHREGDLTFFDLTITASLTHEDLKEIYGLWDS